MEKINLFRGTQYYFDDYGPLGYRTITKMKPYFLNYKFLENGLFSRAINSRKLTYFLAYEKD